MSFTIEKSWSKKLSSEIEKPYFPALLSEVTKLYESEEIYPPQDKVFAAFELCPFDKIKVVILGQDPYHGEGQAEGLSFSVPNDTKVPPSLKNIYKEIYADIGTPIPASGNLEHWAKQGVLLLNATLTVQAKQPGSHQGLGWEQFTDAVIKKISDEKEHVVFLLWGKYAQAKTELINKSKHLVLKPHTHPRSQPTPAFSVASTLVRQMST